MHGLVAALTFFTRLPVARWYRHTPAAAADAAVNAPLAGTVVGAASVAVLLAGAALLPMALASTLAVVCAVLVTGALHEDAFADYCDGLGAGRDRARVLDVMRDPRCGSYGVIGLVLVLLVEVLALRELGATLLASGDGWLLVLLVLTVHAGSRLAAVSFMFFCHRAPDQGAVASRLGEAAQPVPGPRFVSAAAPVLLLLGLLLLTQPRLAALAFAWPLAAWLLGRRFLPLLGGYTGDCLGAVQKLAEVLGLVAACALLRM